MKLEVSRYRSIRDQTGQDAISFQGLDCLVGKNNAGKTNILSAVKYLLGSPEKNIDEELYWQKDTGQSVEVRGFFKIQEADLTRVPSDEKRDTIRESLITHEDEEDVLGVCRVVGEDEEPDGKPRLLQFLPDSNRLSREHLLSYRKKYWDRQKEEADFTKTDYRDKMREEFPEVAELVPKDKQRNQGIWANKFREYVDSKPEGVEYSLQPTDFRGSTQEAILNTLLPQIISIPAVKEVDSATRRGGVFGTLVDQISSEVQQELDEQLQDRLDGFQVREHPSVKRMESHITSHLSSTFEEQSIKFDFPSLSTESLFRNADILIQEEHIEDLSPENVGEGVKRTLIFSLLRTLADIREGVLSVDDEASDKQSRPLLLLYEEAELFLHPSLQKTLLRTFEQLTDAETQVLFSTHSPVLIQHEILDTINIVRKDPIEGTGVTQFHTVLEEEDEANKSRLTDLESVSSYIFSEKVVLVEGISDRLVLEKLAPALTADWQFEKNGIPVIAAGGKGDVCRFKRFLDSLGITTYVMFDVDAAKQECESIVTDDEILAAINEYREKVESEFTGPQYSIDELGTAIRTKPWDEVFSDLGNLKHRIEEDGDVSESDASLLERILSKCEQSTPPNQLWASEAVEEERVQLVESLLDENILLLSGELEDYYPYSGGQKREAALDFNPEDLSREELYEGFQPLESYEEPDMDVFLCQIFGVTE